MRVRLLTKLSFAPDAVHPEGYECDLPDDHAEQLIREGVVVLAGRPVAAPVEAATVEPPERAVPPKPKRR